MILINNKNGETYYKTILINYKCGKMNITNRS